MAKQIARTQRGIFGKLFKALFVVFNVGCGAWLAFVWIFYSKMISQTAGTEAFAAGAASTIWTGLTLTVWAVGFVVLGVLTWATKGRTIIETVE